MTTSRSTFERAERLYSAAVEEFRGLVVADAEAGRGEYMSIVTKHAEILHYRAERVSHETGVPVRVLHALHLLRVRA
jgi:hypothetical protein